MCGPWTATRLLYQEIVSLGKLPNFGRLLFDPLWTFPFVLSSFLDGTEGPDHRLYGRFLQLVKCSGLCGSGREN